MEVGTDICSYLSVDVIKMWRAGNKHMFKWNREHCKKPYVIKCAMLLNNVDYRELHEWMLRNLNLLFGEQHCLYLY